MLLLTLLLGCGGEVTVTPDQGACHDVDYTNPAPSTLEWAPADGGADVWRTYVFLDQSGLAFDPDFEIANGVLTVRERWTSPEGDAPFCYEPHVLLGGYRGTLEVRWFTEDDPDVPFDTLLID